MFNKLDTLGMKSTFISLLFIFISHLCQSQATLDKGKKLIKSSEYELAKTYFKSQIDSCNNTCNDSIVAYLHIYLGKSLQLLNKYETALNNYKKGIELFQNNKNHNGEAFGLISLAEYFRNLRQFDKSITYLKNAEEINKSNKISDYNIAYLYNRYAAAINESKKDKVGVIKYSNIVINIARKIEDKDLEANSLNELGFLYEKNKNPIALEYYSKSYKIYKELNNIRYSTSVLNNMARVLYQLNRFVESLFNIEEGIKMCKEKAWTTPLSGLYYYQYLNYLKLNEINKSLEAYKNYHESYLKARELEWNKSLYQIDAKYELAEKEKQITDIKHKEEIAQIENKVKTKQLYFLLIVGILLIIIIGLQYLAFLKTKRSNEKLNNIINQKKILIQEVHHRVKNNLTFLKGLLYLQAKASNNKETKIILDECQARIQSMALVHQNLYDAEDATKINFKLFLEELFFELENMFDQNQSTIDVDIVVNELEIDMKLSVFLGLILNELITNSYKYAFVKGGKGKINILINYVNEKLELNYSDDGKGLPDGFDIQTSNGFGFKLINILLSQINAQMSYEKNQMNTFTILIPK